MALRDSIIRRRLAERIGISPDKLAHIPIDAVVIEPPPNQAAPIKADAPVTDRETKAGLMAVAKAIDGHIEKGTAKIEAELKRHG